MKFSIISALSENNIIGDKNTLIWRLPSDLKYFKQLTESNAVVMGRKTYESIGRLLPNRVNIILTRDTNFTLENAVIIHQFEDLFELTPLENIQQIFIIGGAEIYGQAIEFKQIETLYLTEIHHHFEGDASFPTFDKNQWLEISREAHHENNLNFDFVKYQRIQ